MKKQRLFDINSIKITGFTQGEKAKWTKAFNKWCDSKYDPNHSLFNCSCMNICDLCEMKKGNAFTDCVETIKQILLEEDGKIPYDNYNFEEIVERAEQIGGKFEEKLLAKLDRKENKNKG